MKQSKSYKVIVSVTNDLLTDNRVHKVCTTLTRNGYQVLLVGRKLPNSPDMNQRDYKTRRMRLVFTKGPLFYAEYNLRLFLFLIFRSFDILLSNDLDSLTANFLVSKIRRKSLVYDSHEYFTEVPELIKRPHVQKIWGRLEAAMLPRIKHAYTVCASIAKIYREKYGTDFKMVRNIPHQDNYSNQTKGKNERGVILYQGALNIGRGLEQVIKAMHQVENADLLLAGDGDIRKQLEDLVKKEKLENKVRLLGRLSIEELKEITPNADVGLSIESDLGLNYRFALPNKLFDYIHAGVPVLVTDLPEMAAIVRNYSIGKVVPDNHPDSLSKALKEMLDGKSDKKVWKDNLKKAASELNWEKEEQVLLALFQEVVKS